MSVLKYRSAPGVFSTLGTFGPPGPPGPPGDQYVGNVLLNPSFEGAVDTGGNGEPNGWNFFWGDAAVTKSVTTTPGEARTGNKAVKLVAPAGGGYARAQSNTVVPVVPGEVYQFSAWVKALSGAVKGEYCLLYSAASDLNYFGPGVTQVTLATVNPVPNVWTQLVAQFVVPAGANYLRIDISGQNASGGSTLLIDDVTMWRLNVQPAETNPLLATMLDPPRSLLYASTNVAVTANTWSLVGSAMAGLYAKGGMELSNSRTTVPKDGLYAIYAQVIFAVATVAPTLAGLMIRKNANGGAASGTLLLNTFSSQYQSALRQGGITGYVEAELVAGDYVEFFVYQAAASGSWTWNGGSSFTYLTARWVAPL